MKKTLITGSLLFVFFATLFVLYNTIVGLENQDKPNNLEQRKVKNNIKDEKVTPDKQIQPIDELVNMEIETPNNNELEQINYEEVSETENKQVANVVVNVVEVQSLEENEESEENEENHEFCGLEEEVIEEEVIEEDTTQLTQETIDESKKQQIKDELTEEFELKEELGEEYEILEKVERGMNDNFDNDYLYLYFNSTNIGDETIEKIFTQIVNYYDRKNEGWQELLKDEPSETNIIYLYSPNIIQFYDDNGEVVFYKELLKREG